MRARWGENASVALGAEHLASAIKLPSHAPVRAASPPCDASAMQASCDTVLIARVAQGDRSAMRELYARHRLRVFRFALRILRDRPKAEDVSSDVFLDVWRQADRFEGRSGVLTWMLGITRMKALSALRAPVEQELDDEVAGAIEDPADNPAAVLQRKERGAILRKCLAKLSAEHREIIDLVYYHEKSVEEVAAIVDAPPATVKTRMFYARRQLAQHLKAAGVETAVLA
jgi:RNA polymerase sigma-70 factor, ECF subfamily